MAVRRWLPVRKPTNGEKDWPQESHKKESSAENKLGTNHIESELECVNQDNGE